MLHLHRSERAEPLADALASILGTPSGDPFDPEVVAVPTRGMERWLSQRLAARLGAGPESADGICANVLFPPPGAVVGNALSVAAGVAPDADPWTADRLVWPLIEVTEAVIEEPWLQPLAAHFATGRARRFARLQAIARLFEEYGVRRPEMLQSWARGEFEVEESGDWQPQLWIRLREHIGVMSPAERLPGACERLREEPGLIELPAQISIFGLTRMPRSQLEALSAIAQNRDVHLMLLHPSPALWDALAADPAAGTRSRLLASWGREVRALQAVIGGRADTDRHHGVDETRPDEAGPGAAGPGEARPDEAAPPATLLATLQANVRADRQPPGAPLLGATEARMRLADDDDSVRVHSCHGRARQVEVLREAILHRLAADPTLEPRDVIVMCPDVETFAPLIEASFGAIEPTETEDESISEPEAAPQLRVRLADRSLRQTNPLLGVIARLLEMAEGRVTASEVIDLADRGPVRARFGFDDDDLAQIREWVAAAGVHWGLDASHRDQYSLGSVESGTWSFGLRRLLLGVAMSEAQELVFDGALPLDDVPSGRIELAGRLAEMVERLGSVMRTLQEPQTVTGWARTLIGAADLLTAVSEQDGWQRRELDRIAEQVSVEASHARTAPELSLPEARSLVGDRLRGRPTRANFRTGQLTVCTLMPMRSVPHRVVCLLGLDDGEFPRQSNRDGDNLLLDDPRPGDRDPRAEDRQLLLDALMAARDALIITYTGNDERTNALRPPAVPVGELLDTIDATVHWSVDDEGRPARERVRVVHPLQDFDPLNFTAGALTGRTPWSFERSALAGARALAGPRPPSPPFISAPLPPVAGPPTLALRDLIAFVEHPVRAFLRHRLGVFILGAEDEIHDALPVDLDALSAWGVGQRLLDGVMAGRELRSMALAEIARGTLPPGDMGRPALVGAWREVEALHRVALSNGAEIEARSSETNVTLADGTRLTGTVPGIRDHIALTVGYSRLAPRHRLAAWVRLLALTAAHPETPFEAVTIGRSRDPESVVTVARIRSLGGGTSSRGDWARSELARLCELYADGMREPLALMSQSGAAYATARRLGEDPVAAAQTAWSSGWRGGSYHHGEDQDPEYQRVFEDKLHLEALEAHAQSIWGPLLERETLESA